jgi:hypothetical protein
VTVSAGAVARTPRAASGVEPVVGDRKVMREGRRRCTVLEQRGGDLAVQRRPQSRGNVVVDRLAQQVVLEHDRPARVTHDPGVDGRGEDVMRLGLGPTECDREIARRVLAPEHGRDLQ